MADNRGNPKAENSTTVFFYFWFRWLVHRVSGLDVDGFCSLCVSFKKNLCSLRALRTCRGSEHIFEPVREEEGATATE